MAQNVFRSGLDCIQFVRLEGLPLGQAAIPHGHLERSHVLASGNGTPPGYDVRIEFGMQPAGDGKVYGTSGVPGTSALAHLLLHHQQLVQPARDGQDWLVW